MFQSGIGIEIGGPSFVFRRQIPVYQAAKRIDGCNFSSETVWEGKISAGNNYTYFEGKTGYQFIAEASDLNMIPDEKYDFLIASHCLEHCANVLKTVFEWKRVVKKNGILLLVLPASEHTFDHKRPVTKFIHLLEDYANNVGEDDLTHLEEILQLHDFEMDKPAGDASSFKERSLRNFENRCLHHHVFDIEILREIFHCVGITVIGKKFVSPYHLVIVGRK